MADIAMCHGIGCCQKDRCYRHTARPDELWQSYLQPLEPGENCRYFWRNRM